MKSLIFHILLFSSVNAYGQPLATTFQHAEDLGFSISSLDSIYKSALHPDPEHSVFVDNQREFVQSYQQLHQDLSNYLTDNDFEWSERIKLFTRVYFGKDGTVDFFLFNPKRANLSQEGNDRLFSLINKFITGYRISVSADTPFAQCSPVTYMPPSK